jgi:[ribosomal protein S18]-alanine N-acetyltransferase
MGMEKHPSSVSRSRCVPVVCRLSPASVDDLARIEFESNRAPWCRSFFAHEFENTYSRIFGARLSGELAGFLVVHVVADEAHVVNLAVGAQFRRCGIGRALMEEVLDDLDCQGINWVYLEVRASNEIALSLYHSLGFYQTAVRKKYYSDNGEDALLLSLRLEEFVERRSAGAPQASAA